MCSVFDCSNSPNTSFNRCMIPHIWLQTRHRPRILCQMRRMLKMDLVLFNKLRMVRPYWIVRDSLLANRCFPLSLQYVLQLFWFLFFWRFNQCLLLSPPVFAAQIAQKLVLGFSISCPYMGWKLDFQGDRLQSSGKSCCFSFVKSYYHPSIWT